MADGFLRLTSSTGEERSVRMSAVVEVIEDTATNTATVWYQLGECATRLVVTNSYSDVMWQLACGGGA